MKILKIISYIINLISISIPFIAYYLPEYKSILWDLSLYAVFILLIIRPLSNIFPEIGLNKLIPLRKNLGIFSAIIVVSFGLISYIDLGLSKFISLYFSLDFWSFENNIFWAHLGELLGAILLITSNKFSMRLLKRNWKRIQRFSYLYFFSGAIYVYLSFDKTFGIISIIIVFELVIIAYIKKRIKIDETTEKIYWKW